MAGLGLVTFAVCQFKHLFKVQTINLLPNQAEVHLAVAIRVVQRCQWGVELGQLDCQQDHDKFLLVMGVQLRHESDDILLGRLCTAAVEDYGVGGSAAGHQAGQNDSNYYILHELTSVFFGVLLPCWLVIALWHSLEAPLVWGTVPANNSVKGTGSAEANNKLNRDSNSLRLKFFESSQTIDI
nr:hypothetical protein [Enterobacter hormaechei]